MDPLSTSQTITHKKANVCQLLDISPRTLENMVKAKQFPPPVHIGKYTYWSGKVLNQWLDKKFMAQENWMNNG